MKRFGLLILVLAFVVYAGWQILYPSAVLRYRILLEVDTPEGMKTGASVVESTYELLPQVLGSRYLQLQTRGEAVVVDLGPRGKLFMTLWPGFSGEPFRDPAALIYKVYPELKQASPREEIRRLSKLSGTIEIPLDTLPILVRFRDEKIPQTVELVEAANLMRSFGEGVQFRAATLEFTNEPLTIGIERVLEPWFSDYYLNQKRLDGAQSGVITTNDLAARMSAGAFKRSR